MAIAIPTPYERTLKDLLSRLTFQQACHLLGSEGARLIRAGGQYEVDIAANVYLGDDLFRLRLPDAVVTITLMAEARRRLHFNCTSCRTLCEHIGAAFSLILEEKTVLGLAVPPPERQPAQSLSEEELVRSALAEREERARTERMKVQSTDPKKLWADYLVTNRESGRTYRVALRGWEPGESYCACPDYRTNTLGVCKHVLHVQDKVKNRFPAAVRGRRFQQKDLAVHLRYNGGLELRLLAPPKLDDGAARIVRPVQDQSIQDVRDLLGRVRKLTAMGRQVTIYPDAEEYINHRLFQERMQSKMMEIRKNPGKHPLRTALLKVELLPYQLDGIAFAAGAGRAILADDMGLGKTIQGIGVAELLAREAGISKVLVICPATLKSQWRSEVHRFCERDCQLVFGGAAERARQYANGAFFTICNYEQVLRDILAIERVPWNLIILDEGQRIKNWEAKTTNVVKALKSPFALVLSGTPLENRLDDLFSVASFIDDRRLGPAFRFFNQHRVVDENGRALGYKNLDELRQRLQPFLLRRTRASVMRDLPPRSTEIVRIAPTDEQLQLHGANLQIISQIVRKSYLTEMDLLRLQKALLLCRMAADSTYLVDKQAPGHSSKLEALDELLGELVAESGRKILLFSEWTTMLGLIEPLLKKHRVHYVRLDGSVPQKKRQLLVKAFTDDPQCRLFITTNAGSTGLNLQAADTVINVDLPWNPAVLEQRIARAHRMGQKRSVQVFVFVTENTIEERLLQTLSAKHELFQAVLDPDSDVDALHMDSGINELKSRLEILLGASPDAAVDESGRRDAAAEAQRLTLDQRREQVALAGGQMLSAAIGFLGELVGSNGAGENHHNGTQEVIKKRLAECLEPDAQGRLKLTVTLPDAAALGSLAQSLAHLLGLSAAPMASISHSK